MSDMIDEPVVNLTGKKQVLGYRRPDGSVRYSWPLPVEHIVEAIKDFQHAPRSIHKGEELLGPFDEGTEEYRIGYELMREYQPPPGGKTPFKFA